MSDTELSPTELVDITLRYVCPDCDNKWVFSVREVYTPGFCYYCSCGYLMRFQNTSISLQSINHVVKIDNKQTPTRISSTVNVDNIANTKVEQAKRVLVTQGYDIGHINNLIQSVNIKSDMLVGDIIKKVIGQINT